MSYNIDTFKVKKISNLWIPVKTLYSSDREDWHPDREDFEDGSVMFKNMESHILGTINGDNLLVKDIKCKGEGSGCVMHYMIEPALKLSEGELIASCVWEGGDCINQLIVKDGVVEWGDIKI